MYSGELVSAFRFHKAEVLHDDIKVTWSRDGNKDARKEWKKNENRSKDEDEERWCEWMRQWKSFYNRLETKSRIVPIGILYIIYTSLTSPIQYIYAGAGVSACVCVCVKKRQIVGIRCAWYRLSAGKMLYFDVICLKCAVSAKVGKSDIKKLLMLTEEWDNGENFTFFPPTQQIDQNW